LKTSKAAVIANALLGKALSIIGYLIGAFFLLGFIIIASSTDMQYSDRTGTLIVCIVFDVFCVCIILLGRNIKHRIKRFKNYVGLISFEHMTSLDALARSTSKSNEFVKRDIQKMIDKKFFANAHINVNNEIIIGTDMTPMKVTSPVTAQTPVTETISVRCSGCGANNIKLKNAAARCEYCGSHIS
jgi:hypothetical protein